MSARRKKKQPAGAPAWMATFADLSTLLMCFFVLLLSFSELNVQKYKLIVGSMKEAFGVQREVFAKESPKGVSFVAREFSPGQPQPSPLNMIQQQTTIEEKPFLDVRTEGDPQTRTEYDADGFPRSENAPGALDGRQVAQAFEDAERLRELLREEVERGVIEVAHEQGRITIRIREKGSFPSGSATLMAPFTPVVRKIGAALESMDGQLVVAGHTDSWPIATDRFRSNWELSSARAVTVVHNLLAESAVAPQRITIEGHADTRPIDSNSTVEGRARNRRVEITIVRGQDKTSVQGVEELSGTGLPEEQG